MIFLDTSLGSTNPRNPVSPQRAFPAFGEEIQAVIFCTSRGAMCAGSAQVTLVELERVTAQVAHQQGEKQRHPNTKQPNQKNNPKTQNTSKEATWCATQNLRQHRVNTNLPPNGHTRAYSAEKTNLFLQPRSHPNPQGRRSRTCVGMNVRGAWRTIARGAANPWEPSGPAVCKTSSMGPGPSAKGGFAEDEGGVPFGETPP